MSEPKNNLPFLSEKQIDEYEKKLLAKMPAFAMGDEAEESRIQLLLCNQAREAIRLRSASSPAWHHVAWSYTSEKLSLWERLKILFHGKLPPVEKLWVDGSELKGE